jgi:adenylate cyclase
VVISGGAFYGLVQWRNQESGPPLPEKPSVAVLPFANLIDDPQQGYFADGIAEDLMTDLSRLSGLFVVSATAFMGATLRPAWSTA